MFPWCLASRVCICIYLKIVGSWYSKTNYIDHFNSYMFKTLKTGEKTKLNLSKFSCVFGSSRISWLFLTHMCNFGNEVLLSIRCDY